MKRIGWLIFAILGIPIVIGNIGYALCFDFPAPIIGTICAIAVASVCIDSIRQFLGVACIVASAMICTTAHAAGNFIVYHHDRAFAQQVANTAEECRRKLALEWLGYELPDWQGRCPISVTVSEGSGGATSFEFGSGGYVGNWRMNIQGPPDRLLDSVVPHEVMHTVFASHFKQPLPRWLDEGSCSTVEYRSERNKLQASLVRYLQSGRGIPFDDMFAMRDYPRDILPLYAQGHSVCTFLQQHDSKPYFVRFVADGLNSGFAGAVRQHYGYSGLGELQDSWLEWVKAGSPFPSKTQTVTANRLQIFAGCGLRWDRQRRVWIRQCQPQTRPVQVQPTRPAAPVQPPVVAQRGEPATDINDLPATSTQPQGPDVSELVAAINDLKKQVENIKPEPGPKGDPGERGPAGKDGATGPQGPPGEPASTAEIAALKVKIASMQAAINRLQQPLTVETYGQDGKLYDTVQIRLGQEPLRLQAVITPGLKGSK